MTGIWRKRHAVMLVRQWQLLRLAFMFFTRLPVGNNVAYSALRLNQANRYFSLVGLIVGTLVALSFYCLSAYFPLPVALVLTLMLSVLLTGAFHEDGLADMADGIGGGMTVERRLAIMKDSRLGTYGVLTLVLALMLKLTLWYYLAEQTWLIPAIVLAYCVSRAVAASLIFDGTYVSDSDLSKSKPLASKQNMHELVICVVVALTVSVFLITPLAGGMSLLLSLAFLLLLFRLAFKHWLELRIGGFTGDCLGAAQQLSELLIYLLLTYHFYAVAVEL